MKLCSLLALGCAALLGACSSTRVGSTHKGSSQPIFQLLDQQAAGGSVAASDLYQAEAKAWRFAIVDEHGRPTGELMRIRQPTDRFGATFADSEGEARTEFWRFDDTGNVVMTATIETKDHAISLFDPPLVVAFKELAAGVEQISESKMKVVDLEHPNQVRETGKAKRTMIYRGDQRLRTPLGEVVARRIEVHFTADLKMADADEHTTLFLVPGTGIVAEETLEEVTLLGAFNHKHQRTLVVNWIAP